MHEELIFTRICQRCYLLGFKSRSSELENLHECIFRFLREIDRDFVLNSYEAMIITLKIESSQIESKMQENLCNLLSPLRGRRDVDVSSVLIGGHSSFYSLCENCSCSRGIGAAAYVVV